MQKMQATGGAVTPSPPALHSPQLNNAAPNANMGYNANQNPYAMQQQPPMMQMGMNIGMGAAGQYGGQQALHPQTQAMHQSVMRNPSPAPQHQQPSQGGYGGF